MKTKRGIILCAFIAAGLALGITPYTLAQCEFCFFKPEKRTSRPWLGVYLRDVSSDLAKKEGMKAEEGAYVNKVEDRSPADSAGIKEGDVIVEFNGRKIYDADGLVRAVQKAEVGIKAKVEA